jgi:hypothetical protein
MRKRRRGDPNAPFKRGRPPKLRPEAPEMVAPRQENAALREEIQKLQRQLKSGEDTSPKRAADLAGRARR